MQNKKVKIYATFLLGLSLTILQAQNTMFVNEKSGAQTPFAFNSINKLTFISGNMTVDKKDGSTSTYALTNIRCLNFGYATFTLLVGDNKNNELMFFPNPVKDQLHIQYESETTGNVQFQILSVQGKIIYQQTLRSIYGTNDITIQVAALEHGLYICRLENMTKIKTTKFIKY